MNSIHTLMVPVESLSDCLHDTFVNYLGLKVLPAHAGQILSTTIVYVAIKSLIAPFISNYFFPESYPKFNRKSKVLWDIGVVQMIKAPLNCILSLAILMQAAQETDLEERVW